MNETAKMTFSRWCISGLVADCRCRRCLSERGEVVTEQSELEAEIRSIAETEKFRERTRLFLENVKMK